MNRTVRRNPRHLGRGQGKRMQISKNTLEVEETPPFKAGFFNRKPLRSALFLLPLLLFTTTSCMNFDSLLTVTYVESGSREFPVLGTGMSVSYDYDMTTSSDYSKYKDNVKSIHFASLTYEVKANSGSSGDGGGLHGAVRVERPPEGGRGDDSRRAGDDGRAERNLVRPELRGISREQRPEVPDPGPGRLGRRQRPRQGLLADRDRGWIVGSR